MLILEEINYSKEEEGIARFSKVLGHPARIVILNAIAQQKQPVRINITALVNLPPTMARVHFMALVKAGLIKGTYSKFNTSYFLDEAQFKEYKDLVDSFLSSLGRSKGE